MPVLDAVRIPQQRLAYYATRISPHRAETKHGYLICLDIPIARTGWQTYRAGEIGLEGNGDDQIEVYRSYEEVFDPACIASFEGLTITSPHPPVFLTAENDSAYSKGHIERVRRGEQLPDGEWPLIGDLHIKDATLISQIQAKMIEELSCGYECKWVEMPERENALAQQKIRGNHVAVVPNGRAGENIRILDHALQEEAKLDPEKKTAAGAEMFTQVPAGFNPFTYVRDAIVGMRDIVNLLGPKAVTDSDPGAVERNQRYNEEALERARTRNHDADPEEKEKPMKDAEEKEEKKKASDKMKDAEEEEKEKKKAKDAEEPEEKKKAKDADEKEEEKERKAKDAEEEEEEEEKPKAKDRRMKDAEEEKEEKKAKDAKAKDAEGGDKKMDLVIELLSRLTGTEVIMADKMADKKETDDADLIPVETLSGKELPENPIPGADAIKDALLKLRPAIADSGDRNAIRAYNDAMTRLKGVKPGKTTDGYRRLATRKAPNDLSEAGRGVHDSVSAAADFENQARQYHRKNPGEVNQTKEAVH